MKDEENIVGIEISLDVGKKLFRIMDYDSVNYGGSIYGSYVDKDDLIRIISNYIRDYVSVDLGEESTNDE